LQGVGKVGYRLARLLFDAGAKLTIADINLALASSAAKEFDARIVSPEEIYRVDAEIFAPCALGGIINDKIVPQLQCLIVAGAANTQLADEQAALELWQRGILYAPDYVINAGGLISALYEMGSCDKETVIKRTTAIYQRLKKVFDIAKLEGIPTNIAADRLAQARIAQAKKA
jgi:leucine dehydrogenase